MTTEEITNAIINALNAHTMTTSEIINVIINALIAFGTIAVAALAIWGDSLHKRCFGPKLSLVSHDPRGSVGCLKNGRHPIYYHLKVVNARKTAQATNCRVLLKKLWRKDSNGGFREVTPPVPQEFVWSPATTTPAYVTLLKDHVLDFGRMIQGDNKFQPCVRWRPHNYQGFVRAHEVVRYGLEIVSDNFASSRLQVFEVAWNGRWSENLVEMATNLQIHEVTDKVPDG